MTRIVLLTGWMGMNFAVATPLHVGEFAGGKSWILPGDEQGFLLKQGASGLQKVEIPELSATEKSVQGNWRGIVCVDVIGVEDGDGGEIVAEFLEPQTGEVLARAKGVARAKAPIAWWGVIASSEHSDASASTAFDKNPGTGWHSNYAGQGAKAPHWLGIEFGEPRKIDGVSYLPGREGHGNGVPKEYRIEIRKPNGAWEIAAAGTSDKKTVFEERKEMRVIFPEALEVEAFRFVVVTDWTGGGFGSAAEITPIGLELPEKEKAIQPFSRIWMELSAEQMAAFEGKSFAVKVSATSGSVVIGQTKFCRVNSKPDQKLLGRSNGGTGPDKLGAGLLGFDALTEHRQAVLTVMKVRENSPAAKAGLLTGDAIVSVEGKPLAVNDLNPGWNWFENSHEAMLGRESEIAIQAGKSALEIGVLRGGKVETLALELPRKQAFTSMNPADDPEAAAMLGDLLKWVNQNQRPDGSWSGDIKHTTLSALALLATEDKRHEAAVKRAVDWSLKEFPAPEKYGHLGFWAGSYAGILYSEWYLRTGDKRVLPQLDALRDWVIAGQHTSTWGVPALGHGPSELPYENKGLVAPACHLLVFEALAMRCGMKSKIWEMIMPYMELSWSDPKKGGHGSLGYNQSYKDQEEFWSRSGLFAMACELRGERKDMRDAMATYMSTRHPWFRNSHGYGEPGGALGLLGLNIAAPKIYSDVIKQYGWWFSLAWEPGFGLHFTTPHMGAPYMGENDLIIPAYALVLQGPKRTLYITGKK